MKPVAPPPHPSEPRPNLELVFRHNLEQDEALDRFVGGLTDMGGPCADTLEEVRAAPDGVDRVLHPPPPPAPPVAPVAGRGAGQVRSVSGRGGGRQRTITEFLGAARREGATAGGGSNVATQSSGRGHVENMPVY